MGIEHDTGYKTSTFQNYSSENKLLQELGDEMFIIVSNTVQSKSALLSKLPERISIN